MGRLQLEKLNKDQLSQFQETSPGVLEIYTPGALRQSDNSVLKIVMTVFGLAELALIIGTAVAGHTFDWWHVAVWLGVIPLLVLAAIRLSYVHHFRITRDGVEVVRQSFIGRYRKLLAQNDLQFLLWSPVGEDRFTIYVHPGVGQPIATLNEAQAVELIAVCKTILQVPAHVAAFELIEASKLGQVLALYRGADFLREVMKLHKIRLLSESGQGIARIPVQRDRRADLATPVSTFHDVEGVTVECRDEGSTVQINEDETGYRYCFYLRFKFRNREMFDTGTFVSIEKANSESIRSKREADWVANYYRQLIADACKKA